MGGTPAGASRPRAAVVERARALVASLPDRLEPATTRIRSIPPVPRYGIPMLLALGCRLAYLFVLTDVESVSSDAAHYNEIAINLADGQGFVSRYPQLELHETAFRPPVYPALLSVLYRLTGPSVLAGKLLNVAIGVAVIMAIQYVVGREAGSAAGFVSAVAVALSPSLMANDIVLLSEPVGLLILIGMAASASRGRWLPFGACAGLLILAKPSGQVIALTAAAWLAWRFGIRRGAAALAVAALLVAPWYVRTVDRVGTTAMYTSNGFNLAAMYSAEAQASGHFVDPTSDERFERWRFVQLDEGLWERELRAHGLEGLRGDPTYVLINTARNTAATFELWPPYNAEAERQDGRHPGLRALTLPLFFIALAGGLVGLWAWRRNRFVQVVLVIVATSTAVNVVLLAPPRLRAPLDLAIAIGIGLVTAAPGRPVPVADAPQPGDR